MAPSCIITLLISMLQDIEPKAVKKIYRKMAMQFHPDKLATLEDEAERTSGEAKFIEITKAMKV